MHDELLALIEGVMDGHDTLAILPTPPSKVACVLLPAWRLAGCTVIVSPAPAWWAREIQRVSDLSVWCAEGGLDVQAGEAASAGHPHRRRPPMSRHKVICLTPEHVAAHPRALQALRKCPARLLVMDDVHRQWQAEGPAGECGGLDVHRLVRQLGQPTVLALACGIPWLTARRIERRLGLGSLRIGAVGLYCAQLAYAVEQVHGRADKNRRVLAWVGRLEDDATAVVHVRRADRAQALWRLLGDARCPAALQHPGQDTQERLRHQQDFNEGRVRIMVSAEGTRGLERGDIRLVLHDELPSTLEAYQRETAIAALHGLSAQAVLLHDPHDARVSHMLAPCTPGNGRPALAGQREAMERMAYFASGHECRWKILLDHLHEDVAFTECGICDNCLRRQDPLAAMRAGIRMSDDDDEAHAPPFEATPALRPGQLVSVLRHGWGQVLEVAGQVVRVSFPEGGTKWFMAACVHPVSPQALRFTDRLLPTRVCALLHEVDASLETAMTQSQLFGLDGAPDPERKGHGVTALGPSDTTDSGSDLAGLELDGTVDDINQDTDSFGTGEHAGAGNRSPVREAYDILPDRIVDDPQEETVSDSAEARAMGAQDEDEDFVDAPTVAHESQDIPRALSHIRAQPNR